MAQELIYTSFPKGVKPGANGFCTVAVSPDMAPNLISRLEGLSGYRHLYMPGTPEAAFNPPNWSHIVINVGNTGSHVIYRVADAGLDYTGRSNKLAHFIVLDKSDLALCGPAAMLTTPGLIDLKFDQQVGTRPFTRPIPRIQVNPRSCLTWRDVAGDAGWAGELAQTAWTGRYACIVYKPGMNVLALIQEAMALLPHDRRWKTTFSTYYSKLPTGIDCQWRCVAAGTPEAAQAIAEVGSGLVIDLSNGALAQAPESPAVMAARTGKFVLAPAADKFGGAAARQRPVPTARPSAEVAMNDSIQNELDTLDSSTPNNMELPPVDMVGIEAPPVSDPRIRRRNRVGAEVKYGLFAAVFALIILLGVVVAAIFVVMFNNSSQIGESSVAVNQMEPDDEGDKTADEPVNEPLEPNADADLGAVTDLNEAPAPVTEPDADSVKDNQPENANSVDESVKEENNQPDLNTDSDQNSENEQNTESEQNKEPDSAAESISEPEKQEDEEENRRKKEKEIFEDKRWKDTDRGHSFIYVDSNDDPDYTRLNWQLQESKLQIDELKLVQFGQIDSGLSGFESKEDSNDHSKYIVFNNGVSTDIEILINSKPEKISMNKPTDESESEKTFPILIKSNENSVCIPDFFHGNVILAKLSDNSNRVISFFEVDSAQSGMCYDKLKRNFLDTQNAGKGEYIYSIDDRSIGEKFSISDIKVTPYANEITTDDGKTYQLVPRVINETSEYEIRIKMKDDTFIEVNENRDEGGIMVENARKSGRAPSGRMVENVRKPGRAPNQNNLSNENSKSDIKKKKIMIDYLVIRIKALSDFDIIKEKVDQKKEKEEKKKTAKEIKQTNKTDKGRQQIVSTSNRYCRIRWSYEVSEMKMNVEKANPANSDSKNGKGNQQNVIKPIKVRLNQDEMQKYYGDLRANPKLNKTVKSILLKLPLYLDVYIKGDPVSQPLSDNSFLWKRIVLPPPEDASR